MRFFRSHDIRHVARGVLAGALSIALCGTPVWGQESSRTGSGPQTPIKHLIIVVGENHTFGNVFGAYQPVQGESVSNLLSNGIINQDGTPGPNAAAYAQKTPTDTTVYQNVPAKTGVYANIDQPNTTYALGQPQDVPDTRFPAEMPNAPFQISQYVPYPGAYTGDPVHRFF